MKNNTQTVLVSKYIRAEFHKNQYSGIVAQTQQTDTQNHFRICDISMDVLQSGLLGYDKWREYKFPRRQRQSDRRAEVDLCPSAATGLMRMQWGFVTAPPVPDELCTKNQSRLMLTWNKYFTEATRGFWNCNHIL
ncbi:hypothetical protein EVAR_94328_1 [Eumeta japonica]|uniref:Uncharacterized protein n=1 Tax=Eumeta variegata TaxID=151549 RepID=A0A4C1UEX2_EUMVA|nr:hypothetical protein EVAR_94328_1 [Eumeta japonica]